MRTYATTEDLQGWVTPVPADAERLLRSASLVIDSFTRLSQFEVTNDPVPMPKDPAILQAFKNATCAQVARMVETGETGTGVASGYQHISLGNATLSAASGSGRESSSTPVGSPEAVAILLNAGLIVTTVGTPW